ncbi:MAG: hypothetical protein CYG60_03740 [Actinobacteria bacterium]|nr:MAG: hypothetical protein CYG60_03740 [Actinomycetota bacterium]
MIDARWREEKEQILELLYRIQADHNGRLPESEVLKIGPWAADAARRAERLWCLVAKGSPPVLTVTYRGRKALEAALARREEPDYQPHPFGGSIIHVETEYGGPVVLPLSYEPYNELKERALEQGVLTQEDLDRVARSPRKEPEEPEEFRRLEELSFPGTRGFAAPFRFRDDHPFGGGFLDPAGHEGPYQVTVTLTRRGAPDVAYMYVTDSYAMEGDSHLHLPPEQRDEDGAVRVPLLTYATPEGETLEFQLLANQQGRLGQIRTVFRAEDADDARRKAYRLLNPFLCDLSYRYDVPIEILQWNVVELATLTVSGTKQDDFREKAFDPEQFLGDGLSYAELPNYEFFTRLYREGANSSSVDYGFLCFFRIAEGVIEFRRKRVAEQEGKPWREVPRPDVFSEDEVVDDDEAESPFTPEEQGTPLYELYKELKEERNKVGHAFLDNEDPVGGYGDIITDRLEGEEQAGTRRARARYLARRMLRSEFWPSDESEQANDPTS